MSAGITQLRPATVIELAARAEIVPLAALFSAGGFGRQLAGPFSTAPPPSALPILPAAKPVLGTKPAERLASSRACGCRTCPRARPTSFPCW
jgi:hypothetical protein